METAKLPINEFIKENFPQLYEIFKGQDEKLATMLYWYITTNNILVVNRGVTPISVILFRPMNKEQMEKLGTEFAFDQAGEYLYIPAFVTKKEWVGRDMWNTMKTFASKMYPNVKYLVLTKQIESKKGMQTVGVKK